MSAYPVQLEVSSPPVFERMQLLVRLGIAIVLGWLGLTMDWLWSLLFLVLPLIAAIVVSARGPDHYLTETGPTLWKGLRWLLAFSAYMLLVTDRIPIDDHRLRADLHVSGRPTVGTSLARLVMSIPSAIVLACVGILSCVLWVVSVFGVLFARRVPAGILRFQTGYLRWQGRLVAYHASLVEEYPPFSLHDHADALPTAMVQP